MLVKSKELIVGGRTSIDPAINSYCFFFVTYMGNWCFTVASKSFGL